MKNKKCYLSSIPFLLSMCFTIQANSQTLTVTPTGPVDSYVNFQDLTASPSGAIAYEWFERSHYQFCNAPAPTGVNQGPVLSAPPGGVWCCVATWSNGSTSVSNDVLVRELGYAAFFGLFTDNLDPVCSTVGKDIYVNPHKPYNYYCTGMFWDSYQWQFNGVNIPSANNYYYHVTEAGYYSCIVSNTLGSQLTDSIYAEIDPPLPSSVFLTVIPGTSPCNGQNVTLIAPAVEGCNYKWYKQYSDGTLDNFTSGINLDTIVISGTSTTTPLRYSVNMENECGTKSSSWVPISWTQTINATFSASGPVQFCPGNSVTLSATQNAGWNYVWRKNSIVIAGATTNNYTTNSTGNYQVTITAFGGCSNSYVWYVYATGPSVGFFSSTYPLCTNSQEYLFIPGGIGFTYQWYKNNTIIPGATNDSLAVDASVNNNSFYVIVNSSCGADTSYNYQVIFHDPSPAVISTNDPVAFCSGDSAALNANYGYNYVYSWNKNGVKIQGGDFISYEAKSTGNYTVTVTNNYGCVSVSPVMQITANALPSASITLSGPATFCSGGSVTLNAPVAANRSYQWKKGSVNIPGATLSSYNVTVGGTYKVKVINTVTGCSKTTTTGTVVTVNPLPSATITPQGPTTFCAGGSVVLKANSGTGLTYQWKKGGTNIPGATSINYIASIAGVYKVKVTNNSSCSKLSTGVTVTIPCKEDGNTFTDNDDNVFDIRVSPNPSNIDFNFEIKNSCSEKISIRVYDLIGNLILNEDHFNPQFVIHIPESAPGIYSALIICGENKKVLKLIKTL